MKFITRLVLIFFACSWTALASAGALEEYQEARKIYVAAAACLASYSSWPGSLAVAAFEQEGWKIEPDKLVGEKADAKYMLAWKTGSAVNRDRYMLAVAGTESVRDVKIDLRANKVYFAGSTPEDFIANAEKKDLPPDVPRVHEGFNQAAQLLLNAGSVQANDSQAGTFRKLTNILKEDHDDRVILTGHSLGGAVVTLVAARMTDMGVKNSQIEVVTFGAPAVGNEAFVKKYDDKISLTRVVIEDDLIPVALRKVFGGYRHIGHELVWAIPPHLKNYISHYVPIYLDLAMKNYYLKRRVAINEGLVPRSEPIPGKNRLYVVPVKNNLPKELQIDFPFMQEALWEEYDRILPGSVDDQGAESQASNLEKAAAAGCTLIVVPEIHAEWLREEKTYYVSFIQTVYRVRDGATLDTGIFGSHTKDLTPLGALVHGLRTMSKDRSNWAEAD